ncbi:hypothetical protein F52700_4822 [Fusarium sp. NRRL 52700]|nr:hypothetical protein F52700_4822 [Fusarium sp. NRRL 52700]
MEDSLSSDTSDQAFSPSPTLTPTSPLSSLASESPLSPTPTSPLPSLAPEPLLLPMNEERNPVVQHPVVQQPVVQQPVVQQPVVQKSVVQQPLIEVSEDLEPANGDSDDEEPGYEVRQPVEAPSSTNGLVTEKATRQLLYPLARRGAPTKARAPARRQALDCPKQRILEDSLKTKSGKDKAVARKMRNYWDQHSSKFSEEMKDSFISAFQKIRETVSNARSPSNHIIWKNTLTSCKEDLDWAKWIVLRAIYYDPILNSKTAEDQGFRANFMKNEVAKRIQERYAGVSIFTAKVPDDLSASRPSSWPVIGDTDGFQAVKEEALSGTRSISASVALLGGATLPRRASAGVKRKQSQSTLVGQSTLTKVPRLSSRLRDADEEIEEDIFFENYNKDRLGLQGKPSSKPRLVRHQMNHATQDAGNKFEPQLHTLDIQNHPVPDENRLVAKITEQVKKELGFATKEDLLLHICQLIGDNMAVPRNNDLLEYIESMAHSTLPKEPPFDATFRHFVANWVRSITDTVKKEILGSDSKLDAHHWSVVVNALHKTSKSVMGELTQAIKDIEEMTTTFKPEVLAQIMDEKFVCEAISSYFNQNDEIPPAAQNVLTKWFSTCTKQLLCEEYKPLVERWVRDAALKDPANPFDDASFTLRISEQLKKDHVEWVDERIQQSITNYRGDAGHRSDKEVNRVVQKIGAGTQNDTYIDIVKALSDYPDIKAALKRVSEQAIAEAIANARSNGQMELTMDEAVGSSHMLPMADRVHLLEQEIRSLKSVETPQAHFESAEISVQQFREMELKLNSSYQKIQQLEACHQEYMARRSQWNRVFAGGFQLLVLGLAVILGARKVAPGNSQYPQLP